MDLILELFVTVSLSFMLTFLFSKLVPVDPPMPEDLDAPESQPEPESLVRGTARGEEEEEEVISGESIEVRRYQIMPLTSMKYLKLEGCAVEESKRHVDLHREIMVCDLDDEYFEDELSERRGFRKRSTCEIEIEPVQEIEQVQVGDEDPNSEFGDWEAIEREDFQDLLCITDN